MSAKKVLDMVKGKARAAGSFLGGIANNPGVVILGIVAIGLFIFKDKISEAFGSLGAGLGDIDIKLPDIKLPDITFPEFKFPEFTFPEFPKFEFPSFPNPFEAVLDKPQKMVEDTGLIDPSTCECGSTIVQDAFGNVNQKCNECAPTGPTGTPAAPFSDAAIFAKDFPEEFVPTGQEAPIKTTVLEPKPIQSFLIDQPTQQFTGGGVSFVGGSIFETPLANLSLSQIIDKFMVTASQAADIKAQAIGFTPEEEEFLQGSQDISGFTGFNPPAVSDPQFQGLTPEQIALQLTGGNISNF